MMSPPLTPARLAMAVAMAGALTACSMVTALRPQVPPPPTVDDLPPNPTTADLRATGQRMMDWADEHCLQDLPSTPQDTWTGLTAPCERTIAGAGLLLSPSTTPEIVPRAAAIIEVLLEEAPR